MSMTTALSLMVYVGISVPGFAILYFHGHANLQKFMLKHCIQDINAKFEHVEYIRWNNAEYHKQIEDKLMSCVKYHIQFTETASRALGLTQVYVLPFQIMGTCVMASILLVFFAFEGSLSDQYLRMVLMVLTTSAMLLGFAAGGQGIEDWSEEIYEALSQVEWYHWNSKNKKTYLFFLMHATRKFKIKYSENISLNYQLGLKVVNAIFSAMSVIYSLQQKKNS
ncbi:putative odorant receptor 83c [Zophobas morio]|uniref:putative odorant receptor 83c n=1 Tax=Zophobas morio TaxID=2755281 RepID=UPI003082BCEB